MIKFILLVNKQGQTRVAQYYTYTPLQERLGLESEIVRRCLSIPDNSSSFLDYRGQKCVFRRYASLYFIIGVDEDENELAIFELIHNIVETFDRYFENVCELDIMFNLDKAHFILEEMVLNGCIYEANKNNILDPITKLEAIKQ